MDRIEQSRRGGRRQIEHEGERSLRRNPRDGRHCRRRRERDQLLRAGVVDVSDRELQAPSGRINVDVGLQAVAGEIEHLGRDVDVLSLGQRKRHERLQAKWPLHEGLPRDVDE